MGETMQKAMLNDYPKKKKGQLHPTTGIYRLLRLQFMDVKKKEE